MKNIPLRFFFWTNGPIGLSGVNEYASSVTADIWGNNNIGGSSNGNSLLMKRNSSGEGFVFSFYTPLAETTNLGRLAMFEQNFCY